MLAMLTFTVSYPRFPRAKAASNRTGSPPTASSRMLCTTYLRVHVGPWTLSCATRPSPLFHVKKPSHGHVLCFFPAGIVHYVLALKMIMS
ncbi:hypothetical protein LY78DRAFT_196584 [Colletotrichum sublineola]|nr:hypothetical protein LY78DRAFT_196584 [Colletotrichum sublineola]